MSDARLHKRLRQDENDGGGKDAEDAGRTRDEEFWFDDGSIILIAGNVDFRVYKGLLAKHSIVFRDMFSLPQPATSEGEPQTPCPVVHLTDSPEEVRCLLRVCMPESSTNPYAHEDPTYESIASSIRLGHKYQITPLVDHAVGYLKEHYTTKWKPTKISHSWAPPRFKLVHAIGVINLARLVGCDTLLPTAVIDCCQLGGELVSGLLDADGTTEHLSPSDLALCVSASIRLARECVGLENRVRRSVVSPSCRDPARCARVFAEKLNGTGVDLTMLCRVNPFRSIHHPDLAIFRIGWLCQPCCSMLYAREAEEGRKLWKRLPSLIGLSVEGWPE